MQIFEKQQADLSLFLGEIELDKAYFGAKRLRGVHMPQKRGRGTWKQPVFGMFEREGSVCTEMIPNSKSDTFRKVIRGKLIVESVVITDAWRGYSGLLDVEYEKHFRIDKKQKFLQQKRSIYKWNGKFLEFYQTKIIQVQWSENILPSTLKRV